MDDNGIPTSRAYEHPNMDETKEKLGRTPSVSSTASTVMVSHSEGSSFHPTRSLTVDAHGIGVFRLPLPSREMEIPIYSTADGSLLYLSTRDRHRSGSAVLSSPQIGDLISTEYFFGPGRDPVVTILSPAVRFGMHREKVDFRTESAPASFKVTNKWTSRATRFNAPGGKTFEWKYGKRKEENGKSTNLLILRSVDDACSDEADPKDQHLQGRIVAELVRGEETRTPGSSRCSSGNGGRLLIDESECAKHGLGEPVVVATCLMMLKKEIDRRRGMQMAMMGAMASGGSV